MRSATTPEAIAGTALDRLVPTPRLVEIDRCDLAAPRARVWEHVRHGDLAASPWIRALFAMRTLGKARAALRLDDFRSTAEEPGFQLLVDEPPHELAVGAIGKVWRPDIPFVHVGDAEAFAAFDRAGFAKVAWAIRVSPREGGSHLELEVRVDATDADSWERFRRYFRLIGPGSRFIRHSLLRSLRRELGAAPAADERPLPGDERIADADAAFTHAIDIAAPPEAIWPWLVQMGCGRAGFYSYDVLDNAGVRSAREIHPELQEVAVGDVLPAAPGRTDGFEVLAMDPPRTLVLGGLFDTTDGRQLPFAAPRPPCYSQVTWSFVLEPLDARSTRLTVRARAACEPARGLLATRVVHRFMEMEQLRELAARAERRLPLDDWRDVLGGVGGAAVMAVALLSPFLRERRSHWGVSAAVAERAYPGDELVASPRWSWTHGVEIAAPAAAVWPWVAQMGADRGGFYSYQWLENLAGCRLRNAETVHPEWELLPGDRLVLHPAGAALPVVAAERGSWLLAHAAADEDVRGAGQPWVAASWLFHLTPLGADRCLLVSRYRASCSDDLATRLRFGPSFVEPVGFAMDRRMLLGVKARAEAAPRPPATTADDDDAAASSPTPAPPRPDLVRPFATLGLGDVALVGGKNASLGEMVRELAGAGVPVPDGFAVTAAGYRLVLERAGLVPRLTQLLAGLDPSDVTALARRGGEARRLVAAAELPPELRAAIAAAYRQLATACGEAEPHVAVRSSATAEDLPEASFAGQQETYLAIRGEAAVLDACRRCFASLFTDRAIAYRAHHGFDHLAVALSVGVQRMVRSDLGAAGVLFTLDTDSGFPDVVLVNGAWGLGETVVRGTVSPDEFCVFKPTLRGGFRPILQRRLGSKESKLVYDSRGGLHPTRVVPVSPTDRARFCLDDDEVLQLARWGMLIEEHYSRRAGRRVPMDIEWAKDGRSGELFILQARPETVHARRDHGVIEVQRLGTTPAPLLTGQAVGNRIGAGPVRVVRDATELARVAPGDVLVAEMTDPDWVPALRKAAALVAERGGRTCHAAIVSRELGIPAVVGAAGALATLADGQEVTVSCAEGAAGRVYPGRLPVTVERTVLGELPRTRTRILLNIADPDRAFALSSLPVDGVGLARIEFLVGTVIGIHPMALLGFDSLPAGPERDEIARRTAAWAHKPDYFVDLLAQGIGRIAAAFYPREVVVRLSDFKTNEYAGLLGGAAFEPKEENPMLGFRGASRYVHPLYRAAFGLECAAIRKVRSEMGLTNVQLMVPFCRTPEEGRRVLAVLAEEGLRRGEDGLAVLVMCEIPSNVLLARELAALFDGFSIGSNDLTQLVLGVDRDSPLVAPVFDERNPAVAEMLARVIAVAHAAARKVSICGQAPSDYPEVAAFLVEHGIDALSLGADAVVTTLRRVAEQEAREAERLAVAIPAG